MLEADGEAVAVLALCVDCELLNPQGRRENPNFERISQVGILHLIMSTYLICNQIGNSISLYFHNLFVASATITIFVLIKIL